MDFNPRLAIGILIFGGLLIFGIYRLIFGTFFEPLDQPGAQVEDYIEVVALPEFPQGEYAVSLGDIGLGPGGSEHQEAVGGAQEPPAPGSCWVYCRDPLIYPVLVEFNPACEVVLVTD